MIYISSKLWDMQKCRSLEVVLASASCFLRKGQMGVIPDVGKKVLEICLGNMWVIC